MSEVSTIQERDENRHLPAAAAGTLRGGDGDEEYVLHVYTVKNEMNSSLQIYRWEQDGWRCTGWQRRWCSLRMYR